MCFAHRSQTRPLSTSGSSSINNNNNSKTNNNNNKKKKHNYNNSSSSNNNNSKNKYNNKNDRPVPGPAGRAQRHGELDAPPRLDVRYGQFS